MLIVHPTWLADCFNMKCPTTKWKSKCTTVSRLTNHDELLDICKLPIPSDYFWLNFNWINYTDVNNPYNLPAISRTSIQSNFDAECSFVIISSNMSSNSYLITFIHDSTRTISSCNSTTCLFLLHNALLFVGVFNKMYKNIKYLIIKIFVKCETPN